MEINGLDETWLQETKRVMETNEGIDFKKFYSSIKKGARVRAKKDTCMWCGRKCTSFCNSHTVPQFILKKIARDGKVFLFNSLAENAFIEYEIGIKKAGNFFLICNDCDSKIFRDYEDYARLITLKKDDVQAYSEIAIKNLFKALYKRTLEIENYKILFEKANMIADNIEQNGGYFYKKIELAKLDIKEYIFEIRKFKNSITKYCNINGGGSCAVHHC